MFEITTERYVEEARKGIQNPVLRRALSSLQERSGRGTAAAYDKLPEGPYNAFETKRVLPAKERTYTRMEERRGPSRPDASSVSSSPAWR